MFSQRHAGLNRKMWAAIGLAAILALLPMADAVFACPDDPSAAPEFWDRPAVQGLQPVVLSRPVPRPSDPIVSRSIVAELITWIGANTDFDIGSSLADPPAISFCDVGETIHYETADVVVDAPLAAAYDLIERRVFLVRPWDPSNPDDLFTLLHELTHDVQFLNREWPCTQAPEWQAYKLQERWLAEQGIAAQFDWLQIYVASKCRREIHP